MLHVYFDVHDVAALYIDPRGPYPRIAGVDAWDEKRDARKYAGPYPVVAHPPCARWCRLAKFIEARCGYRVGDDAGCFESAVSAVRRVGGVLEHPAHSLAFRAFDMPHPGESPDVFGGYTIEVVQVEWGHKCKKSTWLYFVGVPRGALESPPFPGRDATHEVGHGLRVKRNRPRVADREAKLTPPLFAEYLVRLARAARHGS